MIPKNCEECEFGGRHHLYDPRLGGDRLVCLHNYPGFPISSDKTPNVLPDVKAKTMNENCPMNYPMLNKLSQL